MMKQLDSTDSIIMKPRQTKRLEFYFTHFASLCADLIFIRTLLIYLFFNVVINLPTVFDDSFALASTNKDYPKQNEIKNNLSSTATSKVAEAVGKETSVSIKKSSASSETSDLQLLTHSIQENTSFWNGFMVAKVQTFGRYRELVRKSGMPEGDKKYALSLFEKTPANRPLRKIEYGGGTVLIFSLGEKNIKKLRVDLKGLVDKKSPSIEILNTHIPWVIHTDDIKEATEKNNAAMETFQQTEKFKSWLSLTDDLKNNRTDEHAQIFHPFSFYNILLSLIIPSTAQAQSFPSRLGSFASHPLYNKGFMLTDMYGTQYIGPDNYGGSDYRGIGTFHSNVIEPLKKLWEGITSIFSPLANLFKSSKTTSASQTDSTKNANTRSESIAESSSRTSQTESAKYEDESDSKLEVTCHLKDKPKNEILVEWSPNKFSISEVWNFYISCENSYSMKYCKLRRSIQNDTLSSMEDEAHEEIECALHDDKNSNGPHEDTWKLADDFDSDYSSSTSLSRNSSMDTCKKLYGRGATKSKELLKWFHDIYKTCQQEDNRNAIYEALKNLDKDTVLGTLRSRSNNSHTNTAH